MLTDVAEHVIQTGSQTSHVGEASEQYIIHYLCHCYLRADHLQHSEVNYFMISYSFRGMVI